MIRKCWWSFLLLLPAQAPAETDPRWGELETWCALLGVPGIHDFVTEAESWETFAAATRRKLDRLSKESCPAYLANPNAMESAEQELAPERVTLPAFLAIQKDTFTDTLATGRQGRAHSQFVQDRWESLRKDLAGYGMQIEITHCGRLLKERWQFLRRELASVERKTDEVRTECEGRSRARQAESRPSVPSFAARGEPERPAQTPRAPAPSDVTGTQDSAARRAREAEILKDQFPTLQ